MSIASAITQSLKSPADLAKESAEQTNVLQAKFFEVKEKQQWLGLAITNTILMQLNQRKKELIDNVVEQSTNMEISSEQLRYKLIEIKSLAGSIKELSEVK